MTTDALNRRSRFAKPQPRGKRIELQERDYVIFEALDRHGPLPANYLFEFTKHLCSDWTAHQKRLTKLYNGSETQAPFLTRPPQQFANRAAQYQPLIYDLSHNAKCLLKQLGRSSQCSLFRTDPFLHRFMAACVGASIELTALEKGLRYISEAEIFAHRNCPESTKHSDNPLRIPLSKFRERTLIPDDLFGLKYPGRGYRFVAVELDRNTECIKRKKIDQSSFGRKIDGYIEILRCRAYHSHWGIPNLSVLTVTTSEKHIGNIRSYLDEQREPALAKKFVFEAATGFGGNWQVPRAVLYESLSEFH